MLKIFLPLVLVISSLFSQNIVDLSLDHTKQTHRDLIFNELINQYNDKNNYDNLSKTIDTGYINFNSNFSNIGGFNYSQSIKSFSYSTKGDIKIPTSGIDYRAYELYFGTKDNKYIAIKNSSKTVSFLSNTLKHSNSELIFFSVFNYEKISMSSSKVETLSSQKMDALPSNSKPSVARQVVHRDYDLEKFTVSTENLYDITKEDSYNHESYLYPTMFLKTFNNNISIYGVLILGYTQENYTSVSNYFVDANATKHNITYSTKIKDKIMYVDNDSESVKDVQNFVARYHGYIYGAKATIQYKINNISIFATGYQKMTVLKNKYKKSTPQINIESEKNNVVTYEKLSYKQRYLKIGINYRF